LYEDYAPKMNDVMTVPEKLDNPKQTVICPDEKPSTLHGEVRPATGREARRDSED